MARSPKPSRGALREAAQRLRNDRVRPLTQLVWRVPDTPTIRRIAGAHGYSYITIDDLREVLDEIQRSGFWAAAPQALPMGDTIEWLPKSP